MQESGAKHKAEKTCEGCHAPCCHYIVIEVNAPEDDADIDLFRWYLYHHGVSVQIDPDGSWHVIVPTKCEALSDNSQCSIHMARPQVCKDYTIDECERYGPEDHAPIIFHNVDELERYVKEKGGYVAG